MRIFDEERIKAQIEAIKKKKYEYIIGVGDYSGDVLAYVLLRRDSDNNSLFLIGKSMKDEVEFENEIACLAKIFNAKIVR